MNRLDNVQSQFLKDAGVSEIDALVEFHLAPLKTRRDIAMLGVIHRTVLGKGPRHFKEFFQLAPRVAGQRHRFQLVDIRLSGSVNSLLKRSSLGLIAIYNLLPEWVLEAKCVKHFQKNLQELVKERATAGCEDWADSLSPRLSMSTHPLRLY